MGCGNNKVSRDYLASQPAPTPSAKAARAGSASVASQVARVLTQVNQQSASKLRAQAAREAKATQAKTRAEAERRAAAKKTADKKAKAKEARAAEEAQRMLASIAWQALQPSLQDRQLLPGQQERVQITQRGELKEIKSFARKVSEHEEEELVDADGQLTQSPLHIHTKVRDGYVFIQGTDRRDLKDDHFGKIEVFVPDAPAELLDALFDVVADMLRERQ